MEDNQVLRGLATVNFYAADHHAAKKWYSRFLEIEPYFNVPVSNRRPKLEQYISCSQ